MQKFVVYVPEIKLGSGLLKLFFHVSFTSLQPVIKEKDAWEQNNKKMDLKSLSLKQKKVEMLWKKIFNLHKTHMLLTFVLNLLFIK